MKEIDRYNEQHVRQKLYDQPGIEGNKFDSNTKSAFSSPQKGDFTGVILSDSPAKSFRNYPQSEKKIGKDRNFSLSLISS